MDYTESQGLSVRVRQNQDTYGGVLVWQSTSWREETQGRWAAGKLHPCCFSASKGCASGQTNNKTKHRTLDMSMWLGADKYIFCPCLKLATSWCGSLSCAVVWCGTWGNRCPSQQGLLLLAQCHSNIAIWPMDCCCLALGACRDRDCMCPHWSAYTCPLISLVVSNVFNS